MTSQLLRREPADTVCFLDERSNRNLHHSSNSEQCTLVTFLLIGRLPNWPPGSESNAHTQIQRPGVLPLDDPASRLQRYRFHAPSTQHRRLIDVVAESRAINTCAICQLAVISATVAVKFRSKLDLKAFEFNHLCAHGLVAARRIELPSQP